MEALRPDMFHPQCPSRAMPIKVGDKWAALIIRCLEDGPRRFGELRVPLSRVTPKVLTESLRALERDGFVARTAHPGHPPRVEYELTPLGRTLLRPLPTPVPGPTSTATNCTRHVRTTAAACHRARRALDRLLGGRPSGRPQAATVT